MKKLYKLEKLRTTKRGIHKRSNGIHRRNNNNQGIVYKDKEIAMKLACAESTIRNMRFALRERARQARAFLAVMELAEEKMPKITNPKLRVFPAKEEKSIITKVC